MTPTHFRITELADANIDRIVADIQRDLNETVGLDLDPAAIKSVLLISTSIHTAVANEIERVKQEARSGSPTSPLRKPKIVTGLVT